MQMCIECEVRMQLDYGGHVQLLIFLRPYFKLPLAWHRILAGGGGGGAPPKGAGVDEN